MKERLTPGCKTSVYTTARLMSVILVPFECKLEETCPLAKVCNSWPNVVREHSVTEDGVSDLRSVNEVHLKKVCLQLTLLWLLIFERVEEER